VFQRTGLPPDGYEDFTPEDVGKHGGHAKWTGSFFSKYISEDFQEAGHCVLYHHNSQTLLHKYLSTAYGLTIEKREEQMDSTPSASLRTELRTGSGVTSISADSDIERLAPVANHVFLEKATNDTEYRYPLRPILLEREDVMPKPKDNEAFKSDLTEEYRNLWQAFAEEMAQLKEQQDAGEAPPSTESIPSPSTSLRIDSVEGLRAGALPGQDFNSYFFTVYFLLKKYFLRVPSTIRGSYPDISLFDHARVTAALADGLYLYYQEKIGKEIPPSPPLKKGGGNSSPLKKGGKNYPNSHLKKGEEKEFLLIEGDVSGIQSFIFNMVSPQQERAKLAKRLRGRSFYLLLLAETLADYLLKTLDLTIVNLLWCSGGHFFIIAPNTPTVTYHLKACYQDINHFLVKKFQGELGCVLSWEAASGEDVRSDFYGVRQRLTEKTDREKRRKLHNVLDDENNLHFPSEPPKPKKEVIYTAPADRFVQLLNDEQEEIGAVLARLDKQNRRKTHDTWLAKTYSPVSKTRGKNLLTTFQIGQQYQATWIVNPNDVSKADTMYLLNGTNGFRKSGSAKSGFKFIATHVDTYSEKEANRHNDNLKEHGDYDSDKRVEEGHIKGFEDMAAAGKGGFLGVLRMDVDHLGAVFNIGIRDQGIARTASLSSDMELFFTGYFQHLCKREFEKNVYIAYSGGDDLFVVGAWDIVLELACKVREDFKAFTCHNKDINISGGLFLCKGKYPTHRAAERAKHLLDDLAKDNEECEKNLKEEVNQRDALAIFNHRMLWKEFLVLKEAGEELVAAIQGGTLNRTYLYKLLDLHNTWKTYRQLNIARLYYITIRNIKNVRFSKQMISKHQYLSNQSYMPILVGYTALKTRK